MIDLILGETAAVCFWFIIALISGKLLTGYLDIFLCSIGLIATATLVFRFMTRNEASRELVKKIKVNKKMSISKMQELLELKDKKINQMEVKQ